MYHFKRCIWLGTFRYNCTRGQLNNEGGGELNEIKRSPDKTEIGKGIIWYRLLYIQISSEVTGASHWRH